MITTIANQNGKNVSANIAHYDSNQDEREAYNESCDLLKVLHDAILKQKNPNQKSYYHKTSKYAIHRTIHSDDWGTAERDLIITITPDNGLLSKEWYWEDRMIDNSQGGQTHLKGWHLD